MPIIPITIKKVCKIIYSIIFYLSLINKKPHIAKIKVANTPNNNKVDLGISPILNIVPNTTPPKTNLEMSIKYCPISFLISLYVKITT